MSSIYRGRHIRRIRPRTYTRPVCRGTNTTGTAAVVVAVDGGDSYIFWVLYIYCVVSVYDDDS